MTKKTFVVILVLSVVIWHFSRIAQALVEMFILNVPSISPYPTSNTQTGYPIPLNLNQIDNSRHIYYLLNISFWFIVIWGVWKLLQKTSKKKKEYTGMLYLYSSFNNTIAHVTDMSGETISRYTGGMLTKQDRLKANPTTGMFIASSDQRKLYDYAISNYPNKIFFVLGLVRSYLTNTYDRT